MSLDPVPCKHMGDQLWDVPEELRDILGGWPQPWAGEGSVMPAWIRNKDLLPRQATPRPTLGASGAHRGQGWALAGSGGPRCTRPCLGTSSWRKGAGPKVVSGGQKMLEPPANGRGGLLFQPCMGFTEGPEEQWLNRAWEGGWALSALRGREGSPSQREQHVQRPPGPASGMWHMLGMGKITERPLGWRLHPRGPCLCWRAWAWPTQGTPMNQSGLCRQK